MKNLMLLLTLILSACGGSSGSSNAPTGTTILNGGHTYSLVLQGPPGTTFTALLYTGTPGQPGYQEINPGPQAIDGTGTMTDTLVGLSGSAEATRISTNGGALVATLYRDGVEVQTHFMNVGGDNSSFMGY
jgi:hypothetical protein